VFRTWGAWKVNGRSPHLHFGLVPLGHIARCSALPRHAGTPHCGAPYASVNTERAIDQHSGLVVRLLVL